MSWLSRLRKTLRRDKLDDELDEELRAHLEMRAADNVAAGMTPAEARCDAQKRFGNSTLLLGIGHTGYVNAPVNDQSFGGYGSVLQPGAPQGLQTFLIESYNLETTSEWRLVAALGKR